MKQQTCKITIQGTEREYPRETTFQQIADEYQPQMENDIVFGEIPARICGSYISRYSGTENWNLSPLPKNRAEILTGEV